MEESWKEKLETTFKEEYIDDLTNKVREMYMDPKKTIYPEPKNIFNAFNKCPFDKVSVIILGQDPYHNEGQAHGLSFSVPSSQKCPPSLSNIFQEIEDDIGSEISKDVDLTRWAEQGVFLLNAILTVEKGRPASCHNMGWERFTDDVIKLLSSERDNLVFILWGNYAKEKQSIIDSDKHLVLTASHPSPYSANYSFFGCKHFSQANEYLKENGKDPIKW